MSSNTDVFGGIAVFVQVIKAKSFTVAAKQLGHSTSYVSKELTRLEKRLGMRLLNRTTRTISLTDAGRAYYERCNQIVADAEDAEFSITQLQATPRGVLKVNAPVSFGLEYLRAELPKFLGAYPEIHLEVAFNDRMIDVVAEGYDVVIRVGAMKDSNLIARRIMSSKGVVVASPKYLHRHGRPTKPSDLTEHSCISYSLQQTPSHWEFTDSKGKSTSVNVTPRVVCNSAELELAMALADIGITRLPLYCCKRDIEAGNLETILEDYERSNFGVYAIYPHRQYLSAKVQVFINFLLECFENNGDTQ